MGDEVTDLLIRRDAKSLLRTSRTCNAKRCDCERGQEMIETAQEYAARGWLVLPLHSICGLLCSCGKNDCGSPGKHPLTANGFKDATSDRGQIEAWWTHMPEANIGVRTGAVSGFDVVDVDHYKPDGTSLETLCNGHQLPETPIAETGRGGLHYLFKYDGHEGLAPEGVDWKSDGESGQLIRWCDFHV